MMDLYPLGRLPWDSKFQVRRGPVLSLPVTGTTGYSEEKDTKVKSGREKLIVERKLYNYISPFDNSLDCLDPAKSIR